MCTCIQQLSECISLPNMIMETWMTTGIVCCHHDYVYKLEFKYSTYMPYTIIYNVLIATH